MSDIKLNHISLNRAVGLQKYAIDCIYRGRLEQAAKAISKSIESIHYDKDVVDSHVIELLNGGE